MFRIVIPARYESSRLPGKPLAMIAGRPMLQHVYERACASSAAEVIVATDDARIEAACQAFGADVVMTAAEHASGTERVAEVARRRGWAPGDIVVNCQGDAPLVPASSIDQVAELLRASPQAGLGTLCCPITDPADYRSPHVVKVVRDAGGRALYFSRAPIPAVGHGADAASLPRCWRHIGLYSYRVATLAELVAEPPCYLEQCERLEQLRALWSGIEIRVAEASEPHGPDVDTPEDLERVGAILARQGAANATA